MFTIVNIVEKLNFFDIECDTEEVEKLIRSLRLEPIFENEQGELYYDNEAYESIKSYIEVRPPQQKRKTQEEQIINETVGEIVQTNEVGTALVVDNTGKSVEVIANSISKRITADITDFIKKNISTEEAFKAGVFKRDNEILSKKLQDTINDNKKLIEKLRQLEYEMRKFHPVFGNFYIKSK